MRRMLLSLFPIALAALFVACTPDAEPADGLLVPSRVTYPSVGGALEHRCATLDCHGKPERNLRLYGSSGMRLAAGDVPGHGETTEAEYDASYRSVIGLEPEVISLVCEEGGRAPERLSLVRKARGEEAHKGGARIVPGDDADRCLTSWLSAATDEAACARAAEDQGSE
ncbi:hypothetical protein [Polyangium sp. y55x31]|uniref:hypothetical protein n=1 Tax=Polyangium sp. y55x31 TaxID=3042688 RepID=UPI002482BA71|nr:hypothetical protein [Polyangium sp. y55x31]MDI1484256.1 hypothetical protein [Polyangium sp. y55x31]